MDQIDFSSKTIDFVKRFDETSQQEILDALGFTPTQFQEFLIGEREINAIQFFNLAQTLNFSFKAFFEDKIDIEALKKHNAGEINHLPKRYKSQAGVKNFIFYILLEYMEIVFGTETKENILNYLQLPKLYDPTSTIQANALDDFNHYLNSLGFTDVDYVKIGHYSIGRMLQMNFADSSKTPLTLEKKIQWFFEHVLPNWVENKNIHKITKFEKDQFDFVIRPDPQYIDDFPEGKIGTKSFCHMKMGGMNAFLDHLGPNKAEIAHSKCTFDGDEECLFNITF